MEVDYKEGCKDLETAKRIIAQFNNIIIGRSNSNDNIRTFIINRWNNESKIHKNILNDYSSIKESPEYCNIGDIIPGHYFLTELPRIIVPVTPEVDFSLLNNIDYLTIKTMIFKRIYILPDYTEFWKRIS